MATGYTYELIEKPETTFPAFAMRCARAFGALIEMRDEPLNAPIPDVFTPSSFQLESLHKAEARVRELETTTLEQAEEFAASEFERGMASHREWHAKVARENATIAVMTKQVEAWTPPTPEHVDLKLFMLQQLASSVHSPDDAWEPKRKTAAEWLSQERAGAARRLKDESRDWLREVESTNKRNAWVKALRTSLSESVVPK